MSLTPAQLHAHLNDGNWHSGQELADLLGVSRTIVWKQIEKLRSMGVEITASSGKGYRLGENHPGLFDENAIRKCLGDVSPIEAGNILIFDSVGSTNDECMRLINNQKDGQGKGSILVLAEQQTNGKGRRGKQWYSPYASNLYMSISQRFDQGAATLSGLSLVVGIALANVLAQRGLKQVQLKWPNDILFAEKKLGGILLELTGDIAGPCYAVIGIGLNLHMPKEAEQSVDQPYTDLFGIDSAIKWDKNKLVADIVRELHQQLQRFIQAGFNAFQADWLERDSYIGRDVTVSTSTSQIDSGKYVGVGTDGSILIKTTEGVKSFSGGEISLRPQTS